MPWCLLRRRALMLRGASSLYILCLRATGNMQPLLRPMGWGAASGARCLLLPWTGYLERLEREQRASQPSRRSSVSPPAKNRGRLRLQAELERRRVGWREDGTCRALERRIASNSVKPRLDLICRWEAFIRKSRTCYWCCSLFEVASSLDGWGKTNKQNSSVSDSRRWNILLNKTQLCKINSPVAERKKKKLAAKTRCIHTHFPRSSSLSLSLSLIMLHSPTEEIFSWMFEKPCESLQQLQGGSRGECMTGIKLPSLALWLIYGIWNKTHTHTVISSHLTASWI